MGFLRYLASVSRRAYSIKTRHSLMSSVIELIEPITQVEASISVERACEVRYRRPKFIPSSLSLTVIILGIVRKARMVRRRHVRVGRCTSCVHRFIRCEWIQLPYIVSCY